MPDITLIYLRDVVSLVVSGILMASIMISLKAVYTDDMLFLIIIMGVGIIVFFLCNYFVSYVIKKLVNIDVMGYITQKLIIIS